MFVYSFKIYVLTIHYFLYLVQEYINEKNRQGFLLSRSALDVKEKVNKGTRDLFCGQVTFKLYVKCEKEPAEGKARCKSRRNRTEVHMQRS